MQRSKRYLGFLCSLSICLMVCAVLGAGAYAAPPDAYRMRTVPLDVPVQLAYTSHAAWSAEEVMCATRMVYGEARGRSEALQVAVAAVAIQRSIDGRGQWPSDLCGVVRQAGQFIGYAEHVLLHNDQETAAFVMAFQAVIRATAWDALPASYRGNYFFHAGVEARFSRWATVRGRLDGQTFYGLKS